MRSLSLPELGFVAGQALMELLPIWMICSVVQASTASELPLAFAHCYVLQLSAAVLAWHSRRWQLPRVVRVLVLLVAGVSLVSGWLAFSLRPLHQVSPDAAVACLIAVYLCARGLLIGLYMGVLRWFGIGIGLCVMLFAFLALAHVPPAALPFEQLRMSCLAYLALGATLAGLDQRSVRLARSKQSAALSAPALLAVSAPVVSLLLFAVLPAFGPEGTRRLVRTSVSALESVVRWLLVMLRVLGAGAVQFFRWAGSLWDSMGDGSPPIGSGCVDRDAWTVPERFREVSSQAGGTEVLTFVLQALALLCFAYFLIVLARRRAPAQAENAAQEEEEESGSTWSWQLLLQPLNQGWRTRSPASQHRAGVPAPAKLRNVREVYRALLAWATAQGERRNASTTAQEFAEQLAKTHASKRHQISQLTEYYSRERYAERPSSPAETQAARALLEDIRSKSP